MSDHDKRRIEMLERHRTALLAALKEIQRALVNRTCAKAISAIIDHCEQEANDVQRQPTHSTGG